jgi:hypothetical protein
VADAPNGLPQITADRTRHPSPGVYAGVNLREREHMQNQRNGGPKMLRPSPSSTDMLADPRVVLMAIGLFGLALDLFVRPISLTGLALIMLAATPWVLQAWALRNQRVASTNLGRTAQTEAQPQHSTRVPSQEQGKKTSGQNDGVSRAERPSQPTVETIKKVQAAEAAARQRSRATGGAEFERRSGSRPSSEVRASPPRTA